MQAQRATNIPQGTTFIEKKKSHILCFIFIINAFNILSNVLCDILFDMHRLLRNVLLLAQILRFSKNMMVLFQFF